MDFHTLCNLVPKYNKKIVMLVLKDGKNHGL